MDSTFLATLTRLFPRVTLHPPSRKAEPIALGAVVDVSVREQAIVVTLALGLELRFHCDPSSWRLLDEHLRAGTLSFEDPESGLQRLAEILGTLREHLDA